MPKINSTPALEEFKAKYSSVLAEDDLAKTGSTPIALTCEAGTESATAELSDIPRLDELRTYFQLLRELRRWWPIRLLKSAAQERCTDAYRVYLEDLLTRSGC